MNKSTIQAALLQKKEECIFHLSLIFEFMTTAEGGSEGADGAAVEDGEMPHDEVVAILGARVAEDAGDLAPCIAAARKKYHGLGIAPSTGRKRG